MNLINNAPSGTCFIKVSYNEKAKEIEAEVIPSEKVFNNCLTPVDQLLADFENNVDAIFDECQDKLDDLAMTYKLKCGLAFRMPSEKDLWRNQVMAERRSREYMDELRNAVVFEQCPSSPLNFGSQIIEDCKRFWLSLFK